MNLCRFASRIALALLGVAACTHAHAATTAFSGTFLNDASVFSLNIASNAPQNYTFTTTSYAAGGIVPVLTLFNNTTGMVIDYSGVTTGFGDVSLTDTLGAGSYLLDLTEYPNSAVGPTLAAGFYPNTPGITGSNCNITGGGNFYNDTTCTRTTNAYAVTVTNTAVTPEPSTLLLVLPPALALLGRRRRAA